MPTFRNASALGTKGPLSTLRLASSPIIDQSQVRKRRQGRPNAPTEPCDGMRGWTPRASMARSKSTSSGRTPLQPSARTCARSSIIPRTSGTARSAPMPVECERTRLRCNARTSFVGDARLAQRAEAGVDAVDQGSPVARRGNGVDCRPRTHDPRSRRSVELDGTSPSRDVFQRLQRQRPTDDHRLRHARAPGPWTTVAGAADPL